MVNSWMQSLKKYNEGKKAWCIPKKGSPQYYEVLLMGKTKGSDEHEAMRTKVEISYAAEILDEKARKKEEAEKKLLKEEKDKKRAEAKKQKQEDKKTASKPAPKKAPKKVKK